jgi:hypothetical protein
VEAVKVRLEANQSSKTESMYFEGFLSIGIDASAGRKEIGLRMLDRAGKPCFERSLLECYTQLICQRKREA